VAVWLRGSEPQTANKTFASTHDHAVCRSIHRRFGTTYYFATQRFPRELRQRTHAVYAFVRTPDEWVDNPAPGSNPEQQLSDYRAEFLRGLEGVCPTHSSLRAFCDLVQETGLPVEEPLLFLDSMAMDLTTAEYHTYDDLRTYMRGSAAAVGVMMCYAMDAPITQELLACAKALGEAMQLTNFLRDIDEDGRRGRLYLPLEDLSTFDVDPNHLVVSDRFIRLMKFEISRARTLYRVANEGIPQLPARSQPAVQIASNLYEKILDKIEEANYDVFSRRVRTSTAEKILTAGRVLVKR
jgi:phytoene synthase